MMPRLGFEYDSSYTDTDPYEPQPGGCCSYLPYFNESLVELPITLPQDHTVFSFSSMLTRKCGSGRHGSFASVMRWCWHSPTLITPAITGWRKATGHC